MVRFAPRWVTLEKRGAVGDIVAVSSSVSLTAVVVFSLSMRDAMGAKYEFESERVAAEIYYKKGQPDSIKASFASRS